MSLNDCLAMFPGQGSQHVGMGKDLLEQFPTTRRTFEEASDSAKINILKLCLDGPEDQLTLTANTQPCILTVSVAIWRVLKSETGIEPVAYAGHSLGEYSALVAAEKLALERAVFLVRRRGEAMQEAVPAGLGAMAAVLNPDLKLLDQWCKQTSNSQQSVEIVNYNSPQQVVVAGHKTAVDDLAKILEEKRVKFVMLSVSAPFHSRLMEKARIAMTPLLEDTNFAQNSNGVIANLTGKQVTNYISEYLIKQIDSPVLWTQSMQTAEALRCQVFVEVGPGKVLFGLGRRCVENKNAKFMVTTDIVKAVKDLSELS